MSLAAVDYDGVDDLPALVAAGETVYVTTSAGTVAIPSTGGSSSPAFQVDAGAAYPSTLAADKSTLFWTPAVSYAWTVWQEPSGSTAAKQIFQDPAGSGFGPPESLLTDGNYVYSAWASIDGTGTLDTQIHAVPVGGGADMLIGTFPSPDGLPASPVTDGKNVYWVTTSGLLERVPVPN